MLDAAACGLLELSIIDVISDEDWLLRMAEELAEDVILDLDDDTKVGLVQGLGLEIFRSDVTELIIELDKLDEVLVEIPKLDISWVNILALSLVAEPVDVIVVEGCANPRVLELAAAIIVVELLRKPLVVDGTKLEVFWFMTLKSLVEEVAAAPLLERFVMEVSPHLLELAIILGVEK